MDLCSGTIGEAKVKQVANCSQMNSTELLEG
jgi:hypothetical protein